MRQKTMRSELEKRDPELARLVEAERRRQAQTLDLIPSENIVSGAVLAALGSALTNKYSEGYPGKRYYAGNGIIDRIELIAQERARAVFRLGRHWRVNVQPYSGSPANMAVYFALLKPGDKIMGMSLPFGGHLTHGWGVNFSGTFYRPVRYELGRDGRIDYEHVRRLAKREHPAIIVAGATAYPRTIDFQKFSAIAREAGAYFMADIAHIAGLVASGVHPSPFPCADIVTTTTHKTLRGPRGAIIFANGKSRLARKKGVDLGAAIDKAVFPGLQGGPHDHQTAAIAVCLGEAARPAFKVYGRQVVKNAKYLARRLQARGLNIVSGGTDNHLMLVDVTSLGISGREAQERLEEIGVIANRNAIPHDARPPFDPSGIRIGTPSLTARGMKEGEMAAVADLVCDCLSGKNIPALARRVRSLCRKFPLRP